MGGLTPRREERSKCGRREGEHATAEKVSPSIIRPRANMLLEASFICSHNNW